MKKRPTPARFLRLVVYLALMAAGVVLAFFVLPATVRYQVTERYLLDAGRPGIPVHLGVLVPKTGPYQSVGKVQVTLDGFASQEPRGAVDLVRLDGVTPEGGSLEAVIDYDVTLWQGPARWQAPAEPWHLAPQDEIEADHPLLVSQAAQLTGEPSREGAYAIYRFVAGHLDWPSGSRMVGDQSAVVAYQSRVGVCGEFANLTTALCRAAGIPAESITGLAFPPTPPFLSSTATWSHPAGSHAWVEVYTGDYWEFADPSWASRVPLPQLWFGRTQGAHLSYGELAAHDEVYEDMLNWAQIQGDIIGAMSAPLKFAAATRGEGVSVVPTVTVKKTWDGRWSNAVAVFVAVTLGLALLEDRIRQP